ncbi:hypothetical protein I7I50_03752 [Histoplasma capsulatum G186AR]|uniref:Uncharacterized protein n=1 Tax=Ajellomyces capsulatus TaxID=5037 RepID=A0A8H7YNU1_AJECA|nr:hypothetical protein I7I52_04659 [Histoplasma capsulatum]QSS74818.1 hypothetical protein I7I50_03752 [Histoplasma capsulatum G186AR]
MLSRTNIQPSGSLPGLSALRAGLAIRAGAGADAFILGTGSGGNQLAHRLATVPLHRLPPVLRI